MNYSIKIKVLIFKPLSIIPGIGKSMALALTMMLGATVAEW